MRSLIRPLIQRAQVNQGKVTFTARTPVVAVNQVLRNTYLLLSMTLLFSAATAGISMQANFPPLGIIVTLVGYFGLLYAVHATSNSGWGLVWIFALTGFMGLTLGPLLSAYIRFVPNGGQLVMMALGGTGTIFLGLSGYALISRRDFSFMAGFLFVGVLVAFLASLGALFFNLPILALAVSAAFVMLSSGLILLMTSEIIHGGETNYIRATVTLYVAIYNLFISLLHLLSFFTGRE